LASDSSPLTFSDRAIDRLAFFGARRAVVEAFGSGSADTSADASFVTGVLRVADADSGVSAGFFVDEESCAPADAEEPAESDDEPDPPSSA
jgi:hypothetical protein